MLLVWRGDHNNINRITNVPATGPSPFDQWRAAKIAADTK
jgi:hypothetical protein